MESFIPYSALAGGALIGLAAPLLLLFHGRVAGISSNQLSLWYRPA